MIGCGHSGGRYGLGQTAFLSTKTTTREQQPSREVSPSSEDLNNTSQHLKQGKTSAGRQYISKHSSLKAGGAAMQGPREKEMTLWLLYKDTEGLSRKTRRTWLLQSPNHGKAAEMEKQDWLPGKAQDDADGHAGTFDVKGEGSQ